MTDTNNLLSALGELHRQERDELTALDAQASALLAQDPSRDAALQARIVGSVLQLAEPSAPAPAKNRRSFAPAAIGCAIAAAASLFLATPRTPRLETSYSLIPPAADASTRARTTHQPDTTPSTYTLGRVLSFGLRPATRHSGALRVDCYAAHSGKLLQLSPKVTHEAAGGLRVDISTGPGSNPPLSDGSWELLFYVAPASAPAISAQQVRARACPEDTRCLAHAARFVSPQPL